MGAVVETAFAAQYFSNTAVQPLFGLEMLIALQKKTKQKNNLEKV
jgi:hypothetical protein